MHHLFFFVSGDITPDMLRSPVSDSDEYPPLSPKSDTELDAQRRAEVANAQQPPTQWAWGWGQLPQRQQSLNRQQQALIASQLRAQERALEADPPVTITIPSEHENNSPMLCVTQQTPTVETAAAAPITTKEALTKKPSRDIYLDEADALDAEVAQSYINQSSNSHNQIWVCRIRTRNELQDLGLCQILKI